MLILIQWNDIGRMNNLVTLQAKEFSKDISQFMEKYEWNICENIQSSHFC